MDYITLASRVHVRDEAVQAAVVSALASALAGEKARDPAGVTWSAWKESLLELGIVGVLSSITSTCSPDGVGADAERLLEVWRPARSGVGAALAVAEALAPVLGRPTAQVAAELTDQGVKKVMERAGYLGAAGDYGPPTLTPDSARRVVALMTHDVPRARELGAFLTLYLSRRQANRNPLVDAGVRDAVAHMLTGAQVDAAATAAIGVALDIGGVQSLVSSRSVPPILALLRSGAEWAKDHAASATRNLAHARAGREEVLRGGALPDLVALLSAGSDHAQEQAAMALFNLVVGQEYTSEVIDEGAVGPLVAQLWMGASEVQLAAAKALRICAEEQPGRRAVVQAGAVAALAARLRTGTDRVKEEAARVLWNVTASIDLNARVIEAGVVEPLITLLGDAARPLWRPNVAAHWTYPLSVRQAIVAALALAASSSAGVARSPLARLPLEMLCAVFEFSTAAADAAVPCASVLGNLSTVDPDTVAELVHAGAAQPLVALATRGTDLEREAAANALLGLVERSFEDAALVEAGALPLLVAMLKDQRTADRAVEAVVGLLVRTEHDEPGGHCPVISGLVAAGAVPPLLGLLRTRPDAYLTQTLVAVRLMARDDRGRAMLLENGLFSAVDHLLAHPRHQRQAEFLLQTVRDLERTRAPGGPGGVT